MRQAAVTTPRVAPETARGRGGRIPAVGRAGYHRPKPRIGLGTPASGGPGRENRGGTCTARRGAKG
ncbi:hypothetical protein GCM10010106_01060 [Thermopolyspora flexuosa]|nr:hypothetical protein GCM10010106_01060 [Thermopolyspora flexuosa]